MGKTLILTNNELKKLHKINFEILLEFDRVCRKNNIKYSLDGGTLLGAVREKGFIPWDDDVDVVISRNEYNKFVQASKRDLDRNRFFLQDHSTDKNYIFGYAKLRRRGTIFERIGQKYLKQQGGIFMDIFIRDNVPDTPLLRQIHCFLCFVLKTILNSELNKLNASNLFLRLWNRLLNIIPTRIVFKMLSQIASFSNKKNTKLWRSYTFSLNRGGYGYQKKYCKDFIEIEFEGHKFMAYKTNKEYLEEIYGPDFMQRPPVEERVGHNYVNKLDFGDIFNKGEDI